MTKIYCKEDYLFKKCDRHFVAKQVCKNCNYTDKKKGFNIDENIKPEQLVLLIHPKTECFYCGKTIGVTDFTIDRIDSRKPHTPDNIVPCCFKCNAGKCNKDVVSFYRYMKSHGYAISRFFEECIQEGYLNEEGFIK